MLGRLNEMRYTNHANLLEREAARHALQTNVRPVPIDNLGYIEGQNPRDQVEGEHDNQNAPPPDLYGDNLAPPDEDDETDKNVEGRGHAENTETKCRTSTAVENHTSHFPGKIQTH